MSDNSADISFRLARAEQVVVHQAERIRDLEREVARGNVAHELGEALLLAAEAGEIAAPVQHDELLEMIIQTAAHVIGASAASLLLVDQEQGDLRFEVALGEKADAVKTLRVPLGHGIAGLVAVTGQPMAVMNAEVNGQQASDISQRVGYVPHSILCIPLFYHDSVIGVIELFDKWDGKPFLPGDIESLGLFAEQAAVAIEQSRTQRNLPGLVTEILRSLQGVSEKRHGLLKRIEAYTSALEGDLSYRRAIEMARLVHEIVWSGENEATACLTILRGFANYLQERPHGNSRSHNKQNDRQEV